MGLFGFILLVVIILAIVGLGWKTFSAGIITGFEKAVDIGTRYRVLITIIQQLSQNGFVFVIRKLVYKAAPSLDFFSQDIFLWK
jgi:hypothetical protein